MENDTSGGGVQPVCDAPGAAAPFLPVTRRDRLLCVLLASVAVVALVYAARALPDLADALSEHEDDSPATEQFDGGTISGNPAVVLGEDGREYFDISGVYDGIQDGAKNDSGKELPDVYAGFQRAVYDSDARERTEFVSAVYGLLTTVRAAYGREFYESAESCKQYGKLQAGSVCCQSSHYDAEPEFAGRSKGDVRREGLSRDCILEKQELAYTDSLPGNYYRSGVYRVGVDEPTLSLALWMGGVGVKTWCKFYTAFSRSAVGKKIEQLGLAPVLAACIGMGGMTAGNAATEALAIQEEAFYARTEAVLANAAIEADASEIAYAAMSRIVYNQTANIEMSASETAAAVADDIIIAVETGQLPTSANATWETAVAALMEGCLPADMVPAFSKFGSDLIDMFNLENPDEAVELHPYSDAEGFAGSGGGSYYGGEEPVYSSVLGAGKVTFTPETYQAPQTFSGVASVKYWVSLNPNVSNREVTTYYFRLYTSDGFQLGGGTFTLHDPWYPQWDCTSVSVSFGDGVTVSAYGSADDANGGEPIRSYDSNGVVGGSGAASFFDNGGQLVGQDAQFGDGGEILDYGNADISPVLYNDYYNPSTWAEILADLGVKPVNSAGENPSASDEVVAGENKGDAVGDATGKPKPGTSGSAPTVPRLQMQLDGTMADLNGEVSQKFPFSIPYNVSTAVNMLVASPEAPHFTWVFALPTGNVEYEVDLSDFSPVAHVLRTMLDVLMVFCVISLLGKIAQVWGFFDKAAD